MYWIYGFDTQGLMGFFFLFKRFSVGLGNYYGIDWECT